jgi:NTP pyrophosphatase (non-canonical NTP hydrolase)
MQQRPLDRDHLREELGDALWCLTAVGHCLGIDLDELATANIEKLRARYPA